MIHVVGYHEYTVGGGGFSTSEGYYEYIFGTS